MPSQSVPTVGSLTSAEIRQRLRSDGLRVVMGPFAICIRSSMADIAWNMENLYRDYPLADDRMADFSVLVDYPRGLRRWYHPQVIFEIDGQIPYKPYPSAAAIAMMEWGLNWTLFTGANQYLLFHAACLERNGECIFMAGKPGSGKSTLCAELALKQNPWRLLTDELTIVRKDSFDVLPLCRPICLKNAAIDIVAQRHPDAFIGKKNYNTAKGTIAHVRVPIDSLNRMDEPSTPHMILLPQYKQGAKTEWAELPQSEAIMLLAEQSFNFQTLGAAGFMAVKHIVSQSKMYEVVYSDLDDLVPQLEELFDN